MWGKGNSGHVCYKNNSEKPPPQNNNPLEFKVAYTYEQKCVKNKSYINIHIDKVSSEIFI